MHLFHWPKNLKYLKDFSTSFGNRIANDIINNFSFNLVAVAIGIVSSIIISRTLGTAGRGQLAILQWLPNTVTSFATFGFGTSLTYFVSKDTLRNQERVSYLAASFPLITIIIPLTLLGSKLWTSTKIVTFNWEYYILSTAAAVTAISNLLMTSILRGKKKFGLMGFLQCATVAIQVLAILGIYIYADLNILNIWLAIVSSQAFLSFFGYRYLSSSLRRTLFSKQFTIKFIKYSFKSWTFTISTHLYYQLDIFFMTYLVTANEIGLFTVGKTLSQGLSMLSLSILTISFPNVVSTYTSQGLLAAKRQISSLIVTVLVITGIIFLATYLFGGKAVTTLYGNEFTESYKILMILILSQGFFISTQLFLNLSRAIDTPLISTFVWLIMIIIKVLAILLIMGKGLYSIPLAILTSSIFGFFASMFLFTRYRLVNGSPYSTSV